MLRRSALCIIITMPFLCNASYIPERESLAQRYGNKYANLVELEGIVASIPSAVSFKVPPFFGISDNEVKSFLKSITLDNEVVLSLIKEKWNLFKQHQAPEDQTLSALAQGDLASIRNDITKAFTDYEFKFFDDERRVELEKFIEGTEKQNRLLMVRSTGREDTGELANAGGNESIASVQPTIRDITKAMGAVVASYFSKKSLNQRIAGHDARLFDEPFMPVLLQEMIGEQEGAIPVSGVFYSQEAEGRTPGVTTIQATYGHNEAVVNGLVPVDTYYIGPSGIIHPLIRIKNRRLAPKKEGGGLEFVANELTMKRIPCLKLIYLHALKQIARVIEGHYGYPVDCEFVVLNNTIYLVQVRPLEKPKNTPSYISQLYIDHLNKVDINNVFVIGSAGGTVRVIENPQEVIVAQTLNKALDIFLQVSDKEKIKAIIVGAMAPVTSHEAAVFRGASKPVIFTEHFEALNRVIETSKSPLLLDVQRELLVPFIPTILLEFPEDIIVNNAWYAHPIAPKVSLYKPFVMPLSRKQFVMIQPQEHFKNIRSTVLIDMIKNEPLQKAHKALVSLLHRLTAAIKTRATVRNKQLLHQMRDLLSHLYLAAFETYEALIKWKKSGQNPNDRLQKLYPIVFLEALVRQTPYIHEFVDDYSMATLLKIEQEEEAIIPVDKRTEAQEYAMQLLKGGAYAFNDEVREAWNQLVNYITEFQNGKNIQPFVQLVSTYAQMGLLSPWINSSFAQVAHTNNPAEMLDILAKEFDDSKDILKIIRERKQFLNNFALNFFEDPFAFIKQFTLFNNEILKFCESAEFAQELEKAPLVGKLAFIDLMKQVVDVFDISIKTLKSSNFYLDKQILIERFKQMVTAYFNLFNSWAHIPFIKEQIIIAHDVKELSGSQFGFLNFNRYMLQVKELINKAPLKDNQLFPTSEFNVAGAMLTSKASWMRSVGPRPSLEDMFTLTHQNLLLLIGLLTKVEIINSIELPEIFKNIISIFDMIKIRINADTESKASLVSVTIDKNITFFYNLPLRNHSSTFSITYNPFKKVTIFNAQFIGQARERWSNIIDALLIVFNTPKLVMYKEPLLDEKKGIAEFSALINTIKDAKLLKNIYVDLSEMTIAQGLQMPILKLAKNMSANALIEGFNKLLAKNPRFISSFIDLLYLPDIADNKRLVPIFIQLQTFLKENNTEIIRSFLEKLKLLIAHAWTLEEDQPSSWLSSRPNAKVSLPYRELLKLIIILAKRIEFREIITKGMIFKNLIMAAKFFKSKENIQDILIDFVSQIIKQHDVDLYQIAGQILEELKIYAPTDIQIKKLAEDYNLLK